MSLTLNRSGVFIIDFEHISQLFVKILIFRVSRGMEQEHWSERNHSFISFAKFSEKLKFLTP